MDYCAKEKRNGLGPKNDKSQPTKDNKVNSRTEVGPSKPHKPFAPFPKEKEEYRSGREDQPRQPLGRNTAKRRRQGELGKRIRPEIENKEDDPSKIHPMDGSRSPLVEAKEGIFSFMSS